MPIAINSNRPPSATTVPGPGPPSGGGGGNSNAPRTTTTSRRGGRTRSRSPPVMGGRLSGGVSPAEGAGSSGGGNSGGGPPPSSAGGGSGGGGGPSGGGGGSGPSSAGGSDNPSSAAAAAAAAAKAFSSAAGGGPSGGGGPGSSPSGSGSGAGGGGRRSSPWTDTQQDDRYHPHHGGGGGSGYDKPYSGGGGGASNSHWPGEDSHGGAYPPQARGSRYHHPGYVDVAPYRTSGDGGGSGSGFSDHPQHPHHPHHGSSYREMSRGGHHYDDRGGGVVESMRGSRHHPRGSSHPGATTYGDYHHRYGGSQHHHGGSSRDYRGQAPPHYHHHSSSSHHHHSHHHHHSKNQSSSRSGASGTSLVIGGTTPIHVPKTSDPSSHAEQRRGSAASVFRGRPDSSSSAAGAGSGGAGAAGDSSSQHRSTGNAGSVAATAAAANADDSPKKILDSLRTPSASFEDNKSPSDSKARKSSGLSLSPEDPPQIQNSNRGSDQIFESQRNDSNKNAGSIEMAPSFNLFTESFDSFGNSHYFDPSFQNDSFGMMGRTASVENDGGNNQVLQRNSSGGNFSHQFLAPSGSLTIGYSNSFGNASANLAPRRVGSNMMVLGGPDTRSASPTQVLGEYRSYSGGIGPRLGSMDEGGPLHTSVGSFVARSFSGACNDPTSSPPYYAGPARSSESNDRPPPFYAFLRKYKGAFKDCTFLLPGLKAALLEAPSTERNAAGGVSGGGSGSGGGTDPVAVEGESQTSYSPIKPVSGHLPPYQTPSAAGGEPLPQDIAVARRRVESSVCAFGGSVNSERSSQTQENSNSGSSRSSIFRGQEGDDNENNNTATVTPSSTTSPSGASRFQSRARRKYEEALPGRYYENESRLSWEFEETPPVDTPGEDDGDGDKSERGQSPKNDDDGSKADTKKSDGESYCQPISEGDSTGKRPSSASPQPKMRYRCKLCGQPKQNHRCPFQQSLARSIGVTVYPAVNAFTAAEPGTIAAPLSEMNNFVDSQKELNSNESSPNRPTPERSRRMTGPMSTSTQVTPESMMSGTRQLHSPASFLGGSPGRSGRGRMGRQKKRAFSQVSGGPDEYGDLLFVEAMEIKPEQFRIVSKSRKTRDAYCYPSLPLPYAQRKRLSDNLFSLSNEVPKLTDECAQVLREAREKEMWDLAVSELMTQVIVIIHCPDGDSRFEGLRQYLLTLGIAC